MASHHAAGNALHNNFDVDYVISYRFADTGISQAELELEQWADSGS